MKLSEKYNFESEDSGEINISPLIDMVFILLIFFIVTTTFSRQTGVEVNKPKAKSAITLEKENFTIAVTREGAIHIQDKQVDTERLKIIAAGEVAKKPDTQAVIIADRKADAGSIVDVMDVCKLAGIKKISIAALKK